MLSSNRYPPIAVVKSQGGYPKEFPYHPDLSYPEYTGQEISVTPNPVYQAVRESFRLLGLDRKNYGKSNWNPMGDIVKPRNRVFIKPNLVTHEYRAGCGGPGNIFSVITHPSVIRAVADYVALALKGQGEIIIGDNPSIDADFSQLLTVTQLHRFESLYPRLFNIKCRVLDLRPMITDNLYYYGHKSKVIMQDGDPEGSSVINLGNKSYFYGMNPFLFRGVFTKRWETIKHHHGRKHEYSLSNTILNSDVYISIPKLKTHHKVGATLNIKGLVGINYNKNYLIHWKIGFPKIGGDEFPAVQKFADFAVLIFRHFLIDLLPEDLYLRLRDKLLNTRLNILFKDIQLPSCNHYRGAWDGNDTCWRMAADLFKLFIKDVTGFRKISGADFKTFSVVDGIIGGEGSGPFCPRPKLSEAIIAGEDLLLVDCVSSRLMDFDWQEIKYLSHLIKDFGIDMEALNVVSNEWECDNFIDSNKRFLQYTPPSGWPRLRLN